MIHSEKVQNRFWKKVEFIPFHTCYEWVGCTSGGVHGRYGSLKINKKMRPAHRVSWEIHVGPIPAGISVCHKCDNPGCVRPEHLFLGTHKDNMQDRERKGRRLPARGEQSGKAKLTSDHVREIRRLYAEGLCVGKTLAKKFGINPSTLYQIIHRKTWKHI